MVGQVALFGLVYLIFTTLACVMLAYVSMASYLGPFVAPLALIVLGKIFGSNQKNLYIQAACQSGALLCTAIGFVLPAIFFCDQAAWKAMLSIPVVFCLQLFVLISAAGILGTVVAWQLEIAEINPTSELFYTIFQSISRVSSHWTIFLTSALSSIGSGLRIVATGHSFVHAASSYFLPTTFAIGVLSGTRILAALLIGGAFKFFFTMAHKHALGAVFSGSVISTMQQFAVGLLIFDLFFALAKVAIKYFSITINVFRLDFNNIFQWVKALVNKLSIKVLIVFLALGAFLHWLFAFLSLPMSLLVLTLIITVASVNEVAKITSRVGLAPLGRFATFAMFGSMILCQSNLVNIFVACFCAIACAAGANVILQSALANLSGVDKKVLLKHHLIGLAITSMIAGVIFLVMFKTANFQHGAAFAQRAQMRALLMQNCTMEPLLIGLGILTGITFKLLRIEIAMFFAGLLMNVEQIAIFALGSLSAGLFSQFSSKLQINEICSGLLLGESLVVFGAMLIKVVLK